MNKCVSCNILKSKSEFNSDKRNKTGVHSYCKSCQSIKRKEYHNKYISNDFYIEKERIKKLSEYYYKKSNGTYIKSKVSDKNYNKKYPYKIKAVREAQNLPKINGYQKHHWSYDEAYFLDIIYVKINQHRKLHTYLVFEYSSKCYILKESKQLLDTKIKHINFLNNIGIDYIEVKI